MGIDIRASWPGQTEGEAAAQITGFSVEHGHVGYLREAYHGEPYATHYLVPEAFEANAGEGVQIPAAILRERLPRTIRLAIARQRQVYGENSGIDDPVVRAFADFVELCERKEAETGEPCTISASW